MAISALTLSSVDEQIKLLGPAPQIVPKLQRLLLDLNTNPDDILDLIKLDAALAARIVKASNSAYFSRGFPISNIEDGVTCLGYDEVYRILSILAFGKIMRSPLRSFGLDAGQLWRRALACALAMDGLAKTTDIDRRTAYTTGLLHAIGMIFVDHQLALNNAGMPASAREKDVRLLGLTHAEVGAYVLRQWDFPEDIVEPVRCQFEPLDSMTHLQPACLLSMAKCMTDSITLRLHQAAQAALPDPVVMTMLGISEDEYTEVLEETDGKFTLLEIAASDF